MRAKDTAQGLTLPMRCSVKQHGRSKPIEAADLTNETPPECLPACRCEDRCLQPPLMPAQWVRCINTHSIAGCEHPAYGNSCTLVGCRRGNAKLRYAHEKSPAAFSPQGLSFVQVGVGRFELPTFWSQTRRASQTALHPGGCSPRLRAAGGNCRRSPRNLAFRRPNSKCPAGRFPHLAANRAAGQTGLAACNRIHH